MVRPEWLQSRRARRWLLVGVVGILLLAARLGSTSFGTETTLSDGARAYATCKPPWRSARLAPPDERFTLLAVIGGTGRRRDEAVAVLGADCRDRARARIGVAAVLLVGAGVLARVAVSGRRRR